jgi:hypothetical protein
MCIAFINSQTFSTFLAEDEAEAFEIMIFMLDPFQ